MKKVIATTAWGFAFWFVLNALVFVLGGLIVRTTISSEELAEQWGFFLSHATLLYGSIPTIIFTAWAGVSGRLPGTRKTDNNEINPEHSN
jgi:hypothetical protein